MPQGPTTHGEGGLRPRILSTELWWLLPDHNWGLFLSDQGKGQPICWGQSLPRRQGALKQPLSVFRWFPWMTGIWVTSTTFPHSFLYPRSAGRSNKFPGFSWTTPQFLSQPFPQEYSCTFNPLSASGPLTTAMGWKPPFYQTHPHQGVLWPTPG